MAVGDIGPSLFSRDFAMGQIALCVTSVLYIFLSHRSSAILRVIRLIDFVTQLTAVLHAGFLVSCHNFWILRLCFNSRSTPGMSLFMSESVTLLVASVYAEAIEAVKLRAALSASTPELISFQFDINSEALKPITICGILLVGDLGPKCQRH
jgi:hypothetical protein